MYVVHKLYKYALFNGADIPTHDFITIKFKYMNSIQPQTQTSKF